MTDPRLDERREENAAGDNPWNWVPGALFALCVVAGVAIWAYSSGEPPRTASRPDADATTGQNTRPPLNPNPARPAPSSPQR
jgi:hypothetical protein